MSDIIGIRIDEINQIADALMLPGNTYEKVHAWVTRPREEGGFALTCSVRPLEVLYSKRATTDMINARLDKREKLTVTDLEDICDGQKATLSEETHHAILEVTLDLAHSGQNSPHQLLALQRLADFPARAELCEQKKQLALTMSAHRIQMNNHRQLMAEKYFELAARKLAFNEEQPRLRASRGAEKTAVEAGKSQPAATAGEFTLWTAEGTVNNQQPITVLKHS